MIWRYNVNDYIINNAKEFVGKDLDPDLEVASLEIPRKIALDLNLVYGCKDNPVGLFVCIWNEEDEYWDDKGYVGDEYTGMENIQYDISLDDLGDEEKLRKEMERVFTELREKWRIEK